MNRYGFKIGGIEKAIEVESLKLHTALYKLGFILERDDKSHIQPGLRIELVELKKNIRGKKNISEYPKSLKVETILEEKEEENVNRNDGGNKNELDRRTETDGTEGTDESGNNQ